MISEIHQSTAGLVSHKGKGVEAKVEQIQELRPIVGAKAASTTNTSAPVAAKANAPAAIDEQSLEGMVEDLNDRAQIVQRRLQFNIDEESGKTVIKVIDVETEEVIREMPPESILEMQKHMAEMSGLLFHHEA